MEMTWMKIFLRKAYGLKSSAIPIKNGEIFVLFNLASVSIKKFVGN